MEFGSPTLAHLAGKIMTWNRFFIDTKSFKQKVFERKIRKIGKGRSNTCKIGVPGVGGEIKATEVFFKRFTYLRVGRERILKPTPH